MNFSGMSANIQQRIFPFATSVRKSNTSPLEIPFRCDWGYNKDFNNENTKHLDIYLILDILMKTNSNENSAGEEGCTFQVTSTCEIFSLVNGNSSQWCTPICSA